MVAAMKSDVPIINAGDGGHNHPTQTLTDLLTIHREKGRLNNMTIGLCGDLKFGRTVHSLIDAMSRYEGIRFVLISPEELRLPSYMRDMMEEKQLDYVETKDLEAAMPELDVLYMTRVQKERFLDEDEYDRLKDSFILDVDKLKNAQPHMRILHPLPRVNEITVEVDDDPRAAYFRQVENGKFVRMALILKLLEWAKDDTKTVSLLPEGVVKNTMVCSNHRCISNMENVDRLFRPSLNGDGKWRCVYCESKAL